MHARHTYISPYIHRYIHTYIYTIIQTLNCMRCDAKRMPTSTYYLHFAKHAYIHSYIHTCIHAYKHEYIYSIKSYRCSPIFLATRSMHTSCTAEARMLRRSPPGRETCRRHTGRCAARPPQYIYVCIWSYGSSGNALHYKCEYVCMYVCNYVCICELSNNTEGAAATDKCATKQSEWRMCVIRT